MSRRKPPETQASLFGATPAPTVVRAETLGGSVFRSGPQDTLPARAPEGAGTTPDVDDAPERPKLRLVHSVKEWDVTIEAADDPDVFWVTRSRESGTSSSAMLFTRAQLERFIARAQAALKVT